jgi:hypothetical protein
VHVGHYGVSEVILVTLEFSGLFWWFTNILVVFEVLCVFWSLWCFTGFDDSMRFFFFGSFVGILVILKVSGLFRSFRRFFWSFGILEAFLSF